MGIQIAEKLDMRGQLHKATRHAKRQLRNEKKKQAGIQVSQRPPTKKAELERKYAGLLDKPSASKGGYRESKKNLEKSRMPGVLHTNADASQFTSTNHDPTVKPALFPADLDYSIPVVVALRNGRKFQVAALYQLSNRRFGSTVACAPIEDGIATKDESKWAEVSWDSVLSAHNRQAGFLGSATDVDDETTGWDDFADASEGELSSDASSLDPDGDDAELSDDLDLDAVLSEYSGASDDDELVPQHKRRRLASSVFGAYRELMSGKE